MSDVDAVSRADRSPEGGRGETSGDEEAFRRETARARDGGPDPADGEPPEPPPTPRVDRMPPGHDDAGETGPRQPSSNGVPPGLPRPEPKPETVAQPDPEPAPVASPSMPADAAAALRAQIEELRRRHPHLDIPDLGAPLPGRHGPPDPPGYLDPRTVCLVPPRPSWEAPPRPSWEAWRPEREAEPQAALWERIQEAVLDPVGEALSLLRPTSWTVSWSLPPDHPIAAETTVSTPWQGGPQQVGWSFGPGDDGTSARDTTSPIPEDLRGRASSGAVSVDTSRVLAWATGDAPFLGASGVVTRIDAGHSVDAGVAIPGLHGFDGRLGLADIGLSVEGGTDFAAGEQVYGLTLSVSARADDLLAGAVMGVGGVLAAIPPTFHLGLGTLLVGNRIDRLGDRIEERTGMVSFGLEWTAEVRVGRDDGTGAPTVEATLNGAPAPVLADAIATDQADPLLPDRHPFVSLAARTVVETLDAVAEATGLPRATDVHDALPEVVQDAIPLAVDDVFAAHAAAEAAARDAFTAPGADWIPGVPEIGDGIYLATLEEELEARLGPRAAATGLAWLASEEGQELLRQVLLGWMSGATPEPARP
ncbi:hypothetical protein ACTZWW_02515 [Salinarimonas sp. NSM]|uniref:hypothetical protein n=1 Tax=Salinarimonas sp. NSM TaxID=3458003 RepID=UPI0040370814